MLWWCVQALSITWVLSGGDLGLTVGFAFLASANGMGLLPMPPGASWQPWGAPVADLAPLADMMLLCSSHV